MKNTDRNIFLAAVPPKATEALTEKKAGSKFLSAKRHTPTVFYTKKKKGKRISLRAFVFPFSLLLLAMLSIYFYAEKMLTPEIRELAEAQAKKHLSKTVNDAIAEMVATGELRYEAMVRTVRDSKGEVIYLEVDTAMLAGAKAKLVSRIESHLENNKKISLSVPVGSLSEWNLFSGHGIPVRVRIFPIGITEGEIFTVLEDCGINQTRHLIQVNVKATLFLVLPGENAKVDTEVTLPLGERVLVGDVPEIYLDTLGAG